MTCQQSHSGTLSLSSGGTITKTKSGVEASGVSFKPELSLGDNEDLLVGAEVTIEKHEGGTTWAAEFLVFRNDDSATFIFLTSDPDPIGALGKGKVEGTIQVV